MWSRSNNWHFQKKQIFIYTVKDSEKKLGDIYFEQTWILELFREIRKNFEITFKNFQVTKFSWKIYFNFRLSVVYY